MAESVSYWICSCGKSNFKHVKRCSACNKHRPRRWLLFVVLPIALILLLAILGQKNGDGAVKNPLAAEQQAFLSIIEQSRTKISEAPNSLAASEELGQRDRGLSEFAKVVGWQGVVLGVQKMQGKGGISIDLGGANVVAGVHLAYELDTLISPENAELFAEILNLKRGDLVVFSGRFVQRNGAVVELSYTGAGSVSSPEFLFEFSEISVLDQ